MIWRTDWGGFVRQQALYDIPQQLTAQPLYGQVRAQLLERIRNGAWMVGDSLPNENALAKQFGVSVGTVRKAIEGLETNGLVKRIQGRGTYVAGIGSHVLRQKFVRLRGRDGESVSFVYELLSIDRMVVPGAVAKAAGWQDDLQVFRVGQLLKVGPMGVGHEVSYLPVERLPNLPRQMTFGQDLYPILADYGLIVTHAHERLSAIGSEESVADLKPALAPLPGLQVTRLAFCLDKTPIEHRVSQYQLGNFAYDIEIF